MPALTREVVETWVDGYRTAWSSNDPADIRALFTEDARYRTTPFEEGWLGHEAIVRGWLARGDEPGSWAFEHSVVAVDGDVGVIEGRISYPGTSTEYSNLWVVRFGADGRAREYTEWWVDRAAGDPGAPG